jgi:hypothetical protein
LKARAATGRVSIASECFLDDASAGTAKIEVGVTDRLVQMSTLDVSLLGGRMTGGATIDLDAPMKSTANVNWTDIDGAAIAALVPKLNGLVGTFGGFASIRPDISGRPLGALTAVLYLSPTDARFRTIDIDAAEARLAIDLKPKWRVTLDSARLDAAGGVVDLWGRATQHLSDDPILVRAGRSRLIAAS